MRASAEADGRFTTSWFTINGDGETGRRRDRETGRRRDGETGRRFLSLSPSLPLSLSLSLFLWQRQRGKRNEFERARRDDREPLPLPLLLQPRRDRAEQHPAQAGHRGRQPGVGRGDPFQLFLFAQVLLRLARGQ